MKRTITLKPGEIIPINFDFVFTEIFNNPKNIDIIENFLSIYLEVPLSEMKNHVKIQSRDLELTHKKEAKKHVDLLLDLNGRKINIEMSNKQSPGVMDRNVVYVCAIHSKQMEYGKKDYIMIHKTLQINLNNYSLGRGELKESYYMATEKGKILTKKLQIDMIDMVKGREICYTDNENKLARWCKVLTSTSEEELKEALGDDLMEQEPKEKLVDEVTKLSNDEDTVILYTKLTREELEQNTYLAEAKQEGIEQGIKQGIEEGMNKKSIEIARKMLEQKIDMEMIQTITGLTKHQIEEL